MVITYKQLRGEPQYTMDVLGIEEGIGALDDALFQPALPAGIERIEMLPFEAVQQKEDAR
jgi:hypothetical protein